MGGVYLLTDKRNKSAHGGHMWLMILCCLVMLGGVMFLASSGTASGSWTWIIFLLCPLMHVFMMFGMRGHDQKQCNSDEEDEVQIPEDDAGRSA